MTAALVPAADWPGWLGPAGNGSSPEIGVFEGVDWTLELAWSRPLGPGYSGIAVVDGKAITMFGDGATDWLVALDSGTGDEIWRYRIGETFPRVGGSDGGQLGTPVVHRKTVYGLGAAGKLFAVRLADGEEIWSTHIVEEHNAKQPTFGFATTPTVAGRLLFVQTGGPEGHGLTGFDRKTGARRWARGDEAVGYQSPAWTTLAGRKLIVAVTDLAVTGLDSADGAEMWRIEHGLRETWATPIPLGEGRFLVTGGSESAAFQVSREGRTFGVKEIWRSDAIRGSFAMPVFHDGHLYGFDGDFLTCLDATTGQRVWMDPTAAGGVILVDGHLVLFRWDGDVVVAPAGPAGFQPVGHLNVAERNGHTYPSFSDGSIFVRNLTTISRVNVAPGRPQPLARIRAGR